MIFNAGSNLKGLTGGFKCEMIKHSGGGYQCMDPAPLRWDVVNVKTALLLGDKETTVPMWD